jgi:hypothetical protein
MECLLKIHQNLKTMARAPLLPSLRPHHVTFQILVRGERRAGPLAPLTHITFKSLQVVLIKPILQRYRPSI